MAASPTADPARIGRYRQASRGANRAGHPERAVKALDGRVDRSHGADGRMPRGGRIWVRQRRQIWTRTGTVRKGRSGKGRQPQGCSQNRSGKPAGGQGSAPRAGESLPDANPGESLGHREKFRGLGEKLSQSVRGAVAGESRPGRNRVRARGLSEARASRVGPAEAVGPDRTPQGEVNRERPGPGKGAGHRQRTDRRESGVRPDGTGGGNTR